MTKIPSVFSLVGASLVTLLASVCSTAQETVSNDTLSERMAAIVPGLLEEFEIPGAAIALIEDSEITLLKGFGFANLESRSLITPDTVFNVASISKAVTTWGVMKLVDAGDILLDSSINRYLTRWKLADGVGSASNVTIRRLLSHTAGISMRSTPGFRWPMDIPNAIAILNGSYSESTYAAAGTRVEIIYPPGAEFQYSGGGFLLLQLMIEEVTGLSFQSYMQNEVLRPLGMTQSRYGWNQNLQEQMATPYTAAQYEEDIFRLPVYAASSLHSTARDLSSWMMHAMQFDRSNDESIVSSESSSEMFQSVVSTDGRTNDLPSMGLGHFLERTESTLLVSHLGGNAGWRVRVLFSPDQDDGLVVLTNSDNGTNLINALSCIWAQEQQESTLLDNCSNQL